MTQGKLLAAAFAAAALVGAGAARADDDIPVGATQVSGKLFVDVSQLDQRIAGQRSDDRGTGADLKRFYINVDHRFSTTWSAHLTTDINWLRHQERTDLWAKHAYLQGKFSDAFTLRVGAAPMPWMALANQWSGYRYVEKDLTSRAKVSSSSDWGLHALGSLGRRGRTQYALAVVTGAGYKKPRLGNGPDVSARISWQPSKHTVVGVGHYAGTLGEDAGDREALHTARRWSLMAAYADDRWRVGAQYFRATDWDRVVQIQGDRSHGWSAWASLQLTPVVALFARHDRLEPSAWLDPQRRDRYSHVGVEWRAQKSLRLAAVWKHERLEDAGAHLRDVDEAGVWAQIVF